MTKTKTKKMTKAQVGMVWSYNRSNDTKLSDVYGRFSTNKERAYARVMEDMEEYQGFDPRIAGHNSQMFCLAYKYRDEDGAIRMRYHTHMNIYDFEIVEGYEGV